MTGVQTCALPIWVYFSEELKYAESIGYDVTPLQGYLFDKGCGLFDKFVTELYDNRLKAKKEGNDGLSYVYKILMNSLYGRFGINPQSTITEICTREQYEQFLRKPGFMWSLWGMTSTFAAIARVVRNQMIM